MYPDAQLFWRGFPEDWLSVLELYLPTGKWRQWPGLVETINFTSRSSQSKQIKPTAVCFYLRRENVKRVPQESLASLIGRGLLYEEVHEDWERCLLCLTYKHQQRESRKIKSQAKILQSNKINLQKDWPKRYAIIWFTWKRIKNNFHKNAHWCQENNA